MKETTHRTLYIQIFLDLSKAYDSLDRQRTLNLLQQYGLGPNLLGLLSTFWHKLQVVPRQGGFYGKPIKSDRGVTQGDPLSPIVFNVVVDAVVREFRSRPNFGTLSTLFYADDGWVAGFDSELVQQGMDTLSDLFSRMGLMMNAAKTKAMIGFPGVAVHTLSTHAYFRRLSGVGETYLECKRRKVLCSECGKELQEGSLAHHLLALHNVYQRPHKRQCLAAVPQDPVEYRVSLPGQTMVFCPVPECVVQSDTRDRLRRHFAFKHYRDIIIIEEEGAFPRCNLCDMFVSPTSLAGRHQVTKRCQTGALRKQKRILEMEAVAHRATTFIVSGTPLESVDSFKYLGRPLTADGSDGLAVLHNIHRARRRWAHVSKVLCRQGADTKISGYFYKAVCQSVLLYGCETWVVSDKILRSLNGFHHRVARRLSGLPFRLDPITGEWIRSAANLALQRSGLLALPEYILRRRRYLVNWIQDRPLLQLTRNLFGGAGGSQCSYWWSSYPNDL